MSSSSRAEPEVDTCIRQQDAVRELGRRVLGETDLDRVLRDASETVAETLDADVVGVFQCQDGDDAIRLRAGVGWRDGAVGAESVPAGPESLAGYALTNGESVVDDVVAESRFSRSELLTEHGVASGIGVVVGTPGDPWGVLAVHATEERAFAEHDAVFLESVANVLASAIETERAERRLESRVNEVLERVTDAVYALDDEWRFTYVNDRAEALLGHSADELRGEVVWDVYPGVVDSDLHDRFREAMESQEPVSFERFSGPLDIWEQVEVYPSESGLSVYFRDVTERKVRENELERYETTVETVWDGVTTLDADDQFVMVNETFCEMTGYDRDELLGAHVTLVLDESVYEEAGALNERVAAGELDTATLEYDLQTADGGSIPVEARFGPCEFEDGTVGGTGVIRDVSEREARERELEEQRERYRRLTEAAPVPIATYDSDGTLTYVNQAGVDLVGVTEADDLVGESAIEFAHPDDRDAAVERMQRVLEEREPAPPTEMRMVLPDGEVRHTIITTVPITHEGVPGGQIVLTDITGRKEREQELEQYRALTEAANDVILTVDDGSTIRSVNPAVEEVFGYEAEELVGESLTTLMSDDLAERHLAALSRYLETGEKALDWDYIEIGGQHADGSEVPVSITFSEVTYEGERYFTGVIRDVTDRKERERALVESEQRYRTLVENFPNGAVALVDDDLRYRIAGGTPVDVEAETAGDLEGTPIREAISSELADVLEPRYRAALDGESSTFEQEHGGRYSRIHIFPVRDDAGEVFAAMGMSQDVTARRRFEEAIRTLHETSRELFHAESDEEVGRLVVTAAADVIGLSDCALYLHDDDRGDLYPAAKATDVGVMWDELPRVPPDDSTIVGNVYATGESVRWDDIRDSPNFIDAETDMRSGVFAPVGDHGAVFAGSDEVGVFDERTLQLLDLLAANAEAAFDRVERERRLEESERLYRTLAENFPDGAVGVYDHDLRYTLAAGAAVGESLPSADRIEGTRMPDIYPEDVVADLEPVFRAAIEDGETGTVETEVAGRNWRVVTTPLRGADGEVFAGLSFAQDITERVEYEREIERALDLLEKTERIADVGGWEVDPDTLEVFWSDHLFDILDVSYDEQPSLEAALDVYHTEVDRSIVEDAVEEALESGEPFDVEARFPRPSGDVGWLRVQGDPEVADGAVVSLRGAVQDVTERKERERKLEELVERLEESNERLEQFAYAASHDLQEPLRMVSSYLQLVERRYGDQLDADGEEFLEFAVDGADRMREMIDGLLEYARVETRGDPFERVDLDAVFADARRDLQVMIEDSDAEITAESLPTVDGDGGQLNQVFQNLLRNAIENSGDDPPRIHVSAERDGNDWVVAVRDEGVGIDPAETDRIFEVFQSLHGHGHEGHPGTGIGLALCDRIVERHGGDIWVESAPDEGATFSFTLPEAGDTDE